MKRVAVIQSNYLPWKGYFDIIHDVDEFVFHDDVQYTKQDWRNRNRIKTSAGVSWLTIPVGADDHRLICDVRMPDQVWQKTHWMRLVESYRSAPFFDLYEPVIRPIFLEKRWTHLSDLNQHLIKTIASLLGIETTFLDSRELVPSGRRLERLLFILNAVGAELYVSGPAARSYIEPSAFEEAGIELRWKDYAGYPEYTQHHPPFAHDVTVLDLMFHTGPDAPEYIWGWRSRV